MSLPGAAGGFRSQSCTAVRWQVINPDCEMDAAVPIYSIDCNTVTDAELQAFQSEFSFRAMFPGELHGFCAYFDVVFGPEIVVLSTSPHAVPTHWQQSLFYFDKPVGFCPQHQEIKGEIRVSRDKTHNRRLVADIECEVPGVDDATAKKRWNV